MRILLMLLLMVMFAGCSAAGVKNKYDQAGPSSSMTGPGTHTRTWVKITKAGEVVEKEVIEDGKQ